MRDETEAPDELTAEEREAMIARAEAFVARVNSDPAFRKQVVDSTKSIYDDCATYSDGTGYVSPEEIAEASQIVTPDQVE